MTGLELVTAADVQLMQGLAQRVAARPDLAGAGASYAEPAWTWGQGSMSRKEETLHE